jgi:Ca2+-binding EF-hand superfamily protein
MRRLTLLLATAAAAAPQKDHRTRIKQDGAQDAAGVLSPAPPNRHASWLKALHHADANGDGAVSEGEWRTLAAEHEALSGRFVADAAAPEFLRHADADADGFVSRAELVAVFVRRPHGTLATSGGSDNAPPPPPPLAHPHHHPGGGDAAQVMRAHDADGDGKLSRAEVVTFLRHGDSLGSPAHRRAPAHIAAVSAVTAVHKHGGGGGGGGVASAERQRLLELLGGVGDGMMEDLAALASSHRMLKRSFSEEL